MPKKPLVGFFDKILDDAKNGPADGTSTVLIDDLLKKPQTAERDRIIKGAVKFDYDDFKSEQDVACPKMQLHAELHAAGYKDLANNVTEGKYD